MNQGNWFSVAAERFGETLKGNFLVKEPDQASEPTNGP